MKIGVIKERKVPSDSRVCLPPLHCRMLIEQGIDVVVESSDVRVFDDSEYISEGVPIVNYVSDCDVLIGVKEVPIKNLIPNKTYFFFSHTFKKQEYNRGLLQNVLKSKIRLIDYEAITDDAGKRLIAFGRFAGIVGAHNGIYTYLRRAIPRMKDFYNYKEATEFYKSLQLPNLKVVLTGTGRVANGAAEVLDDMSINKVSPMSFVKEEFDTPVYTQLSSFYYVKRKDGRVFDDVNDFYNHPKAYDSDFSHFLGVADLFINGIYWDPSAPAFFTLDDLRKESFGIDTIADVTCDIAPDSSIPTTLRPSTIVDPIYGVSKTSFKEVEAFQEDVVNMMAIDNLPNELPRDASESFGDMFLEHVFPELKKEQSVMLDRASITTSEGSLNTPFEYLQNFVDENDE